jgi:hypothetical protein
MVEMVGVAKSTGHETGRERKIKVRCFVQNTCGLAPARGDVKLQPRERHAEEITRLLQICGPSSIKRSFKIHLTLELHGMAVRSPNRKTPNAELSLMN